LSGARPASLDAAPTAEDGTGEQRLTTDIVALAKDYGRYGDRRIHALLGNAAGRAAFR
jgi:hypothetical protein